MRSVRPWVNESGISRSNALSRDHNTATSKTVIPVYMSSLIAFSRSQLEALADAEGMTGTASSSKRAATVAFADPNDNSKRQRFEQWGAQVAASINGDSASINGDSTAMK